MAMINGYIRSISILNVMNQNFASMMKHMRRVATGQRINSVADDPSGWAIGTRMGIEIRGLDQANRNAQSSQSMLKVAEGAVSSTIDILRTLKEKAIEAANDTCTDADRDGYCDEDGRPVSGAGNRSYRPGFWGFWGLGRYWGSGSGSNSGVSSGGSSTRGVSSGSKSGIGSSSRSGGGSSGG